MPTFTPPVVSDVPTVEADSTGAAFRLFRYFQPRQRYAGVFLLSNNTFAQDVATPENSNTNVPYPWDPYNPAAPIATYEYYDFTLMQPVSVDVPHDDYVFIVRMYMGGPNWVTSAEATLLTAAGYGAYIT